MTSKLDISELGSLNGSHKTPCAISLILGAVRVDGYVVESLEDDEANRYSVPLLAPDSSFESPLPQYGSHTLCRRYRPTP
jgi:hypothetical protein